MTESEHSQTTPPQQKKTTSEKTIIGTISFVAALAVLVSLIACAISILNWELLKKTNIAMRQEFQMLNKTLQHSIKTIQKQQDAIDNNKLKINKILQNKTPSGNDALYLSEATYLGQLAEYSLTFQHNIPLTIHLLELTKKNIDKIANINTAAAITALGEDISALKAMPDSELPNILDKISVLQKNIDTLPLKGTLKQHLPSKEKAPLTEDKEKTYDWRKELKNAFQDLQKLIVIRRHDKPIEPIIAPVKQAYLIQNINLLLQQAQWAAIQRKESIYKTSLEKTLALLSNYFQDKATSVNAVTHEINTLLQSNVDPTLPTLKSPTALQALRQQAGHQ